MYQDVFEYRRQARSADNYLALGLVFVLFYLGLHQGWGLVAGLLLSPFLAFVLVRLVLNDSAGFRLGGDGLTWHAHGRERRLPWHDLNAVTIGGDGAGGADCLLHLRGGETAHLPATGAFAPERLAQEFRLRGVPVWRPAPERLAVGLPQLQ